MGPKRHREEQPLKSAEADMTGRYHHLLLQFYDLQIIRHKDITRKDLPRFRAVTCLAMGQIIVHGVIHDEGLRPQLFRCQTRVP